MNYEGLDAKNDIDIINVQLIAILFNKPGKRHRSRSLLLFFVCGGYTEIGVTFMTHMLTNWTRGRRIAAGVAVRMPGERIASAAEVTGAYTQTMRDAGLEPDNLVVGRQVHGSNVKLVGMADTPPDLRYGGGVINGALACDGLLTTTPGVAVGVLTADCVPVLLYNSASTIVAAVHAGWRGLAAGVLQAAVTALHTQVVSPETLHVYLGPCICQRCFETGPEVADAFIAGLGIEAKRCIAPGAGDRTYVDLRGLAVEILQRVGVPARKITQSPDCTACRSDLYWSHRKHDLRRGNQLTFIALV